MTPSLFARQGTRLGWALFAASLLAVFGYAVKVHRAAPFPAAVPGEPGPDGTRFGLGEERRRAIFQDLVRGEPGDRERAARNREGVVWIRNHDDYFHELEAARVGAVARRHNLPPWQAWLILDEGLRGHWTPPPGVDLYADDAPYVRFTRPYKKRPLIVAGPRPPAAPAPAPQRSP